MELQVEKDTVSVMGMVCDAQLEIPMETEILIPDYLPAVFKIVKTLVHRVILQRQIQAGHLLVEGYFRIEVLYQGEDQNLCAVEQKVAFSKQQDLKGVEECETPEACQIDIAGEVQYVNCRALSQHRLDLRGAYNLSVHAVCDFRRQVITALAEEGMQAKNVTVPSVRICSSREKQFTLEEPITFPQPPELVLHSEAAAQVQEVHIVGGKAVAKGEMKVELVYRLPEVPDLQRQELTMPFNQVVELEGAGDDCECQALIEPVGCAVFSEGAQEGETKLSCTCLLTVRALQRMEYTGVADCFSTQCQTEVEYRELATDTLLEAVSTTVEVRADGKLPDDSLQVLLCFAECAAPELVPEGDRTVIRGRAVAHLICHNALGEIDCYDKTCEYLLPKRYDLRAEEITAMLGASCDEVHFSQTGDEAVAEIAVHVKGFLCRKQRSMLVESVACTQPLEADEAVALRVYYACAGENVFDIAKRYHASPSAISALAGMEGDVLQQNARLLIPQSC